MLLSRTMLQTDLKYCQSN